MSDTITATVVENIETITATINDGGDTIIAHINELARGPAGPAGDGGGGGVDTFAALTDADTADLPTTVFARIQLSIWTIVSSMGVPSCG